MKTWLLLMLTLLVTGCANLRQLLTDEEKVTYDELLLEEATLAKQLEVAVEPEERVELEAKLDVVQGQITALEEKAIKQRFGPIWGTLTTLPIVGPYLQLFGPLAGSLVLPVLSKRGRKHYKNALKNVAPGVLGADGSRGIAVAAAVADVLRALGLLHSTPASKEAANAA